MSEEGSFCLEEFLTDSLSLQVNTAAQTRFMNPTRTVNQFPILQQDPLDLLGETAFGQPKNIPEGVVGTPIQEFYRGVNVLITGGTGFIGKVLTEKLIRSIPHLGHVYLLIRAKRGKTCKERFENLMEDKLFSRMKTEVPHYFTKITPIDGDISEPDLGLSEADHQLFLDQVQVVFHCAADVRFIEPLRVAIDSNVLGSKRVLDLAKRLRNLQSYVHISTAFSQCVRRVIEENVPKMSTSYKEILEYVETSSDEDLGKEPLSIMQGWPNTYTFTKAMCEDMIQEEAVGLPVCIFRPSVVSPTYKEPVRGWTDNIYGPVGLLLAVMLGVLHCFKMDIDMLYPDNVPVDYCVNCMIAAAWSTSKHRESEDIIVFNYTNFANRFAWRLLYTSQDIYLTLWPFYNSVWKCSCFLTTSTIVDELIHFFLHRMVGKVLDTLAVLTGKNPRLTKIYERLQTVKKPLKYFTHKTWEFKNDNITNLWNNLLQEEKMEFNFDLRDINVHEQVFVSGIGLRYYYLKEPMENIPAARWKYKWLSRAHFCLKVVSSLVLLKLCVYLANILPI